MDEIVEFEWMHSNIDDIYELQWNLKIRSKLAIERKNDLPPSILFPLNYLWLTKLNQTKSILYMYTLCNIQQYIYTVHSVLQHTSVFYKSRRNFFSHSLTDYSTLLSTSNLLFILRLSLTHSLIRLIFHKNVL